MWSFTDAIVKTFMWNYTQIGAATERYDSFFGIVQLRLAQMTLWCLEIFKRRLNYIILLVPAVVKAQFYQQTQHSGLLHQGAAADWVLMSGWWRIHMENRGCKHTCIRQTALSSSTSSPSASLWLVMWLAGILRGNLIHLYRCSRKHAATGAGWQAQ